MQLFTSTVNQMIYLFALIIVGFVLSKCKILPAETSKVIAKLENNIFIPCLVLGTFISNFTVDRISSSGTLFLSSFALMVVIIPFSIFVPRLLAKDSYTRNIYTYGLAFSNFGFMGNSVVKALFPDIFMEYLIFTLPLWILIYLWGVPALLMPSEEKLSLGKRMKNLLNPMFIAMIVGMIIGLCGFTLPSSINTAVTTLGDCMSPLAMILTGVTVAGINVKKVLTDYKIYAVSVIRLIIMPLVFIGITYFFELPNTFLVCAICSLAMPLGLNTIVIPSAYGRDTSTAAGMALISHALSCLTIPLVFFISGL
ncbi:MAG: AEC family transporter [Clostridia bacterium]|nr:AEC family transporter [Clostridia bacterium]